jgi:hypothetical protein
MLAIIAAVGAVIVVVLAFIAASGPAASPPG